MLVLTSALLSSAEPIWPTLRQANGLMRQQKWVQAATVLDQITAVDEDNALAWFQLGYACHAAGQLDRAIKAHTRAADFPRYRSAALYNLACAHALKGNADRAFAVLEQARQAGFRNRRLMLRDPDLKSLRGDARYDALLPPPQPADRAGELEAPVSWVNLRDGGGVLSVPVTINEEGPFRFLIDSGLEHTVCVDPSLLRRLGLDAQDLAESGDGEGKEAASEKQAVLDRLSLEQVSFAGVVARVQSCRRRIGPGESPIVGFLGLSLFREFLLTIDLPNKLLVLTEGELGNGGPRGTMKYEVDQGRPTIRVRVDGQTLALGVDTTQSAALALPGSYLDRLAIVGNPQASGTVQAGESRTDVVRATLAKPIVLAGRQVDGVQALFSDGYDTPILGCGLLRGFALTFDQANGRVRLTPGNPDSGPRRRLVRDRF
ncbi:MAG: hypothetical protein GY778_29575 [bacterium]|nr:hypothetical protein [bacterium]